MGIASGGFVWRDMPGNGIGFPSSFLGMGMGSGTQWMPLGQSRVLTIEMYQASGQGVAWHPDYNHYAIGYTYQLGKGRFYFQSSAERMDLNPVLGKALKAGLQWVMAN